MKPTMGGSVFDELWVHTRIERISALELRVVRNSVKNILLYKYSTRGWYRAIEPTDGWMDDGGPSA